MAAKISKNSLFLISLMVILILSACQSQAVPENEALAPTTVANLTQEQILTIGVVSDDPAGTIEGFQPLMDYLVSQLGDLGVVKGEVVVTPDFDTLNEKLKSGEVDLFYETAYGALYAYENAGAIPLLRGWRKGLGEYHSTIFAKKDSGITSVSGLQGQPLAFAEPDSTSGYFLPKAFLISSGFALSESSTTGTIPTNEIGFTISGSDENVVSFVLHGTAVGGALEYDVYEGLKQEDKDQFRVLAQTQDIPRSLMLASPMMSQPLRDRVVSLLKEAAQTEEGKAALKGAKKTTQFDEFPLGPQATMEFLQELFASVE